MTDVTQAVEVTDDDYDKAAQYLTSKEFGASKAAVLDTLQKWAEWADGETIHPLVYLFATHREAAARQARVEALREAQEAIGRVQKPLVARIDQEAIDFAIRAFAAIEALIAKDTTHDH